MKTKIGKRGNASLHLVMFAFLTAAVLMFLNVIYLMHMEHKYDGYIKNTIDEFYLQALRMNLNVHTTNSDIFLSNDTELQNPSTGFFNTRNRTISVNTDRPIGQVAVTYWHELGHAVHRINLTDYELEQWDSLHESESVFVSNYAKKNPAEDFAETFAYLRIYLSRLPQQKRDFMLRMYSKYMLPDERGDS